MQLGKGVKQQMVDKALSKVGGLLDGEQSWGVVKVNNFRPTVDLLLVTNARLLAIASIEGKVGFAAPHPRITSCEYDSKKGHIRVITADDDMTFKATDRQEGVAMVQHYLEYARTTPAPEAVAAAAEHAYIAKDSEQQNVAAWGRAKRAAAETWEREKQVSQVAAHERQQSTQLAAHERQQAAEAKAHERQQSTQLAAHERQQAAEAKARERQQAAEVKARAKREVAEAKERAKQESAETKKREKQQALDKFGREVASAIFGLRTVAIYDKGYVRVGGPFGLGKSGYEKLIAIEASADITKKTGAGRAAGAVLTGGLNLLSSNKRGDAYLSIVTEVRTHVLHEEAPTATSMRDIKRLEGAGNGVLSALARAVNGQPLQLVDAPAETPATQDVGERLSSLAGLREQGLISEDEYETLRANILKSL